MKKYSSYFSVMMLVGLCVGDSFCMILGPRQCDMVVGPGRYTYDGVGNGSIPSSSIYEGDWRNREWYAGCKGAYFGGNSYSGIFAPGEPHGRGKMQYFGGNQYEGIWENGKRHGYGIETYYISPFNKDWKDNPKKYWGAYEGNWKDDFKSGRGKMVYVDGSLLYDGDWLFGEMDGHGTKVYPNGDIYEGYWFYGLMSYGKMTYSNRDGYEGEWFCDKKDGQGKMTLANGTVYIGEWVSDIRHGYGEITAVSRQEIHRGLDKWCYGWLWHYDVCRQKRIRR